MFLTLLFFVCQIAALACALVAGVLLTFSDFMMRSLDEARDSGVQVMRIVNRQVMRSVFMALFLGMAALSPAMIFGAWTFASGASVLWITAGGAIYFAGVFGVTAVFNVPMNNALDRAPDGAAYWTARYFPDWTSWNSLRTVASVLAALCFLNACVALA